MNKILFAILMSLSMVAFAQELVDKSYSATSTNTNLVEARKEIQEQINQQVTEELAKQILGEDKFLKNRAVVMGRIAKSSGRFIPFQKPGALKSEPSGFTMSVAMKVNVQAFRQLLQQSGLLNENESAPVLLPLIQVVDRVQLRSDRWWNTNAADVAVPLRSLSRRMENSLRDAFSKAGFFVIRPVAGSMSEAIPYALRAEKHSPDDLKVLGDWFGAPLVIDGTLQVSRPKEGVSSAARLDLRLQVIQVSDNRPIADVSRSYDTDAGPLEVVVERKLRDVSETLASDLASQVAEAWQKGAVGSSQIRLNLSQRLPLPEIEKFKQALASSSLGLRTVRERVISSSGVVFEVESPSTMQELAGRMDGFQFNGRALKAQVMDNEIRLEFVR
ncbi:MAG: hypothetical protein KF789_14690 [Bdellovibrionaceae bacterium]|nr:hypothetical protein [Pseudobdellovibrionaceae bacterium]